METAFPDWTTLRLGTDQPTNPAGELESRGFRVSDWGARPFLAKMLFASEPTAVDIVRVTVAELGLADGATTTEDIFVRAAALGLNRLPVEAGYRLRLALTDQPMNEWIRIGMEPIADPDGFPCVIGVVHDEDGQWLRVYYPNPTHQWGAESLWVFGRN